MHCKPVQQEHGHIIMVNPTWYVWYTAISIKIALSKAEKSNTSAKGLPRIVKKLINFLAIPSKHFVLVFDFST